MPAQILWRVDIINKNEEGEFWHAIKSHVRFIHVTTGTVLRFTGRQLPAWGFNQHEVAADKNMNHPDNVWNVEEHRYTKSKLRNFRLWHNFYTLQFQLPTRRRGNDN